MKFAWQFSIFLGLLPYASCKYHKSFLRAEITLKKTFFVSKHLDLKISTRVTIVTVNKLLSYIQIFRHICWLLFELLSNEHNMIYCIHLELQVTMATSQAVIYLCTYYNACLYATSWKPEYFKYYNKIKCTAVIV